MKNFIIKIKMITFKKTNNKLILKSCDKKKIIYISFKPLLFINKNLNLNFL